MSRAPRRIAGLISVGLVSALAATAARAESARDAGGRPDRVTEGTLFWRTAQQEALVPAPVLQTDVHMVVTGIVARASVRQEFTNPSVRARITKIDRSDPEAALLYFENVEQKEEVAPKCPS